MDFAEALRANVVYLWNRRVHASEIRRALELNIERGGMKRLMEETVVRHVETIHYSMSAGIRVVSDKGHKVKDFGFWPLVLEDLASVRLRKEEADRAERRVREIIEWGDPVK